MKNNHMFLRISIFALFLTAFQLQAADKNYTCSAELIMDYIKEIKLEITLCAPECPQEVVNVIGDHLKSIGEAGIKKYAEDCIMIINAHERSKGIKVLSYHAWQT